MPKELWFLCDLITKLGMHQEQLFLQPGLSSEVRLIIDWLDSGLPAEGPNNVSIHSAAETLLLFLESLRIPIVPYNMYAQCLERYVVVQIHVLKYYSFLWSKGGLWFNLDKIVICANAVSNLFLVRLTL